MWRCPAVPASTKDLILEVALRRFGDHGFAGTSLNDIADEVGIRRPSLLHHFPSKEALYRAVLFASFADWTQLVERGDRGNARGLAAGRTHAARRVHLLRGPSRVRAARPLGGAGRRPDPARRADRACCGRCSTAAPTSSNGRWTPGGSGATTPRQLLLTGYGAVLSYLSDGQLMTGLLDVDPLSPEALAIRREHVIDVLRTAVALERRRRDHQSLTRSLPVAARATPRRRTPRAGRRGPGPTGTAGDRTRAPRRRRRPSRARSRP